MSTRPVRETSSAPKEVTCKNQRETEVTEQPHLVTRIAAGLGTTFGLIGRPLVWLVVAAIKLLLWLSSRQLSFDVELQVLATPKKRRGPRKTKYGLLVKKLRKVFEHKMILPRVGGFLVAMAFLVYFVSPSSAFSEFTAENQLVDLEISETPSESLNLITRESVQAPLHRIAINQGFRPGHPALDLGGDQGDKVYSIMPGSVEMVVRQRYAYGNHVIVDHGGGVQSLYAHLSRIFVEIGDPITMDTVLGAMGSTGNSTGDHLHLEVIDQGRRINPMLVIGDEIKAANK